MLKFALPVLISTYYFYSFKPVTISNAAGRISDLQNEALAVGAGIAEYFSHEKNHACLGYL